MDLQKNNLEQLYTNIKNIIEESKKNVVRQINYSLIITYWNIGKVIKNNIIQDKRAEYGKETIKKLAERLTFEYGKGFGQRNIFRMIRFYDIFKDEKKLTTLSAKLSWSHFVELIRIDDELKRDFYITMCDNENWSVRTLRERINSMLYEKTAISKKPDKTIKNDLEILSYENKMSTSLFLRDPYILDFLELKDTYSEKDLENAILIELENFILEFGSDFAFMSRQKRIQIGDTDYYLDLLFYHRKLRRLVLIELKIGEFMPEYKGKVELYLKWLSKYEKQENEEEPIAIILCSGKDDEVIELMELEKDNIHISEYWLKLPPKEILKQKLHKAIEYVKQKIRNKEELF